MSSITHNYPQDRNPALFYRKVLPVLSGRAMGGSTAVNIGAYTRPGPEYFDGFGLDEWTYEKVLPYFKKQEDYVDHLPDDEASLYGKGGPIHVTKGDKQTVYDMVHEAASQLNPPIVSSRSGVDFVGLPQIPRAIRHGRRIDSYSAYLKPILHERPNLCIRRGAFAKKIVIDENTNRVQGLIYEQRNVNRHEIVAYKALRSAKPLHSARANKEIIVSAGVYGSPLLLLQSGIGNKQELHEAGIPHVYSDLPGVGLNLQARVNNALFFQNENRSAVPEMDPSIMYNPATWAEYEKNGNGPFSLSGLGVYSVVNHRHDPHHPEKTDYIMLMTDVIPEGPWRYLTALGCANLRVKKAGYLKLRKGAPYSRIPHLSMDMLGSQEDFESMQRCIMDVREMMKTPAFKSRGYKEFDVTAAMIPNTWEGAALWLKGGYTFYAWHTTSSCSMGNTDIDPYAVLDQRARVKGIHGLRVADGSILPSMIEAGPMATTYMVGEKVADMIKQDNMVVDVRIN